ncbi:MAG: tetratricopeptide repeat protein [Myxococcota bacterium]|nr:tetratricopeptide repeat protein [Myxococcota bacterium]
MADNRTRRLSRRIAHAVLVASLLFAGLPFVTPSDTAWAAESSKKKKKSKRKSFVLSPVVFKKMNTIHKLLQEDEYAETVPLLQKLAGRSKLTDFEKGSIYETLGFAYSSLADYPKAAASFEKSLATDALPDLTLLNMRFNLAQLYLALEDFPKAIAHLEAWMAEVETPSPEGHYYLGAAHAQLGEAKKALPYIAEAVARSTKFNETWNQLLLALYFELKQYDEAVGVLAALINHSPRKSYLQQLQGVYGELGQEKKALAVMELSYRQGYLENSSELRNLAHLYLYHEVPSLAAEVLSKGLEDGTIDGDRESWELLGDAYIHAREYKKAVAPLRKAAELAEDGEVYLKLARIQLEYQDWEESLGYLERAIEKGQLDNPGDAQLMLGISSAKSGRFGSARRAFEQAAKNEDSKKSAINWLRHLEELEAAAARERDAGASVSPQA